MASVALFSYIMVGILVTVAGDSENLSPVLGSGNPVNFSEQKYLIDCDQNLDNDCKISLERIANNTTEHSWSGMEVIYITISVPNLLQKGIATFSGIEAVTISGDADKYTTITCKEGVDNTGLMFTEINKVTLRDLTLINCGAVHKLGRFMYSSAVLIIHGRDILVDSVNIEKSTGIGLTILNHLSGSVHMKSSNFYQNTLPEDYAEIQGGGGVYVGEFEQDPSEPIIFQFEHCIFEHNIAHTRFYDFLYTDDLGERVSGYGLGGGAAILLEKALKDVYVIFSQCIFLKNEAFKGAGLCAEIEGDREQETRNVSVQLQNCYFEENGCSLSNMAASGGGVSINYSSRNRSDVDSNEFGLFNVTFNKNCAQFGGGLYFYSEYLESADLSNTLDIVKCTFTGNSAHTGSAVDITPNVFERVSNGILTTPAFKDCNFFNNTVILNFHPKHTQTTYGIATVYSSLFNIRFEGYNRFENNVGTAIHIVNGNLNVSQSSVDFIDNRGIQGGAVALIGQSSMIIGPNSYTFKNNTALDKGGAMYVKVVDNHDITASKTCFIQYEDKYLYFPTREWNATVTFVGNRADTGTGHSIFATSLYPCQIVNLGELNSLRMLEFINSSEVFTIRRIFFKEGEMLEGQQVATEGGLLRHDGSYLEVVPGEQFAHGVTIIDDLSNQAQVVLTASISNNINVRLDTAFSTCVGEKMVLKGSPGEVANLYLHTTTSRLSYIKLMVRLIECPPGFMYSEISSKCICISSEYVGLLTCNTTRFYSYITPGFWIGMVNDSKNSSKMELVTSFCPETFCNYSLTNTSGLTVQLPRRNSELNEAQCGVSRTGVACGRCAIGYTTYYHSPYYECKRVDPKLCKVGWLFYILSELVPVTVVFVAVVTLNINFTSGSVNGFILFTQLLSSLHIDGSGIIKLPTAIYGLSEGYKIFYGFFNLDFFQINSLSFCLWPNASALDMLAFKYVTIIYAFLLTILVIWFISKCGGRCLGKWFRITKIKSSVIHGISAFLLLCYSQCIRVSLNLLTPCSLFTRDGSDFNVSMRVWLDANVPYFSSSHLPYALPALFCLLFVGVIPPLLLVAYPLTNRVMVFFGLEKLSEFLCKKLRIVTLKPLLDSFQGTFKDNMRFFAGLYFLYRWIVLMLTIILSNFDRVYTAVEIVLIIILILHALCQPYASKAHNIIDTLLFGNLALINAISFAHYVVFRTKAGTRQNVTEYITASASVQLVLIYLPLFIMSVYIIRLACQLAWKRVDKDRAEWTSSIALQRLSRSFSKEDNHDKDDLPYRLIEDDVDSKLKDTDHSISIGTTKAYSTTIIDSSY